MRKIWISILISLFCFNLWSQEIEDRFNKNGFENVLVQDKTDTLVIFFEHREFRNPFYSILFAELLLKAENLKKRNYWIPVHHNQPVARFSGDKLNFQQLNQLQKKYFRSNTNIFKNYRFNLRLQPEMISRFGYYSDPFKSKFNLILDTRIYLASGLSLQTGITIPVVNNLDDHGMKLRVAPSYFHYFTQPWNSHFFSFSAGTFYNDRYGLNLEYRNAKLNSSWSFGFAGGVTGFYRFSGLNYNFERMGKLFAVADVEWRTGIENTSLKISAGQFLYNDKGARLDFIKQFPAAELGMFAAQTEIGTTGGFSVTFSLFTGKIFRGKKLEFRTTENFKWEYEFDNDDPVAQQVRIGMPNLSDILRNYNEEWIQNLSERN